MADVESELRSTLTASTGLTDLTGTRIYALRLPQKSTLPALSFNRISTFRDSVMGQDTGTVSALFQVDVWARSYDDSRDVAEQVRTTLQRYTTIDGSTSTGQSATIETIFMQNDLDLYESDTEIYHAVLDFNIHYLE